ncbi:MAG: hypothetical protein AAB682_02095 [Patescibacteria group bacterium]
MPKKISISKKEIKPKKVASKKVPLKKKTPNVRVEGALCFYVNNGPIVCDLFDLKNALRVMSDDSFRHHTVRDGNDFSRWIRDALQNESCAREISICHDRHTALQTIDHFLNQ